MTELEELVTELGWPDHAAATRAHDALVIRPEFGRLAGLVEWLAGVQSQFPVRDIARARTFGFMRDVTALWNAGYALGASLENTLVVSENRILNPEGPRFPDEFVRHKVLDAVGDLALAGGPLLGTYKLVRGGHKLNHAVLCALMADRSAWTWVEGDQVPARGHADLTAAAPAFGPDIS